MNEIDLIPSEYVREIVVNYKRQRRRAPLFDSPESVTRFLRETLTDNAREHFIALYLSATNQIIGYAVIGIGTQNRCLVNTVEVFQKAVLLGAYGLIVAHNHPSGNPTPSPEDKSITERLGKGAELLGIKFLDHIIFTDEGHFSFNEMRLLTTPNL